MITAASRPQKFLSTPSARRATGGILYALPSLYNFYPRPPRGGRPAVCTTTYPASSFLSTPSARRATRRSRSGRRCSRNFYPRPPRGGRPSSDFSTPKTRDFYPRPPRGGRPFSGRMAAAAHGISIHALREEGDLLPIPFCSSQTISIHALREEGDVPGAAKGRRCADFYPRPPRGGRPGRSRSASTTTRFLSTPSARRATDADPQNPLL